MAEAFPSSARYVIIGGGIMGSSTAYHLALNGERDVLVLERSKLQSGTTWHAAGLVNALRPSASFTSTRTFSTTTAWPEGGLVSRATNQATAEKSRPKSGCAGGRRARPEGGGVDCGPSTRSTKCWPWPAWESTELSPTTRIVRSRRWRLGVRASDAGQSARVARHAAANRNQPSSLYGATDPRLSAIAWRSLDVTRKFPAFRAQWRKPTWWDDDRHWTVHGIPGRGGFSSKTTGSASTAFNPLFLRSFDNTFATLKG